MYNLAELSENEIKYICERMSFPDVRYYFQKNPKAFNKIKPGFTVKRMSDEDTLSFLMKFSKKPFVQSYISNVVNEWLSQIQENLDILKEQGYSDGEALLKTLPDCYFSERIELYFKLTEQVYDDRFLDLLRDALSLVERVSKATEEENHTTLISERITAFNDEISKLNEQLVQSKNREEELQHKLLNSDERLLKYETQITEANDRLKQMSNEISELKNELERYRKLERYVEDDLEYQQPKEYQYTSIGQINYDYDGNPWIYRLADISENGVIIPFILDKSTPHYFANRDRLYWNNGPSIEKAVGVWNWSATPRDTDSNKDFVKTDYCYNVQPTQIVRLSNCESLDDISYLLKNGISLQISCSKILFVYEEGSFFNGLLCSSSDYDKTNSVITLKATIYTLLHYCIKKSDVIELSDISVYKYITLGMPQDIFKVYNPCEAVKLLVISRITKSSLREYALTTKEVQKCRRFLKSIPTQTSVQDLMLAYDCTNEEAQRYINSFIEYSEKYLLATDLDVNIISRAIQGSSDLVELCKQQLTDEWRLENEEQLAEAENKLQNIVTQVGIKQSELQQTVEKKEKISLEIEQLNSQLSQREQLATDVEEKIAFQIERAKQDAADFISKMAFVSPISSQSNSKNECSSKISVFNSHIDCVESGEIDDIDTFEEEISDNLSLIGYDDKQLIEISQAISFGMLEKIPLVINENSKHIAQCVAAILNGGVVSEIFIPVQGIFIEDLSTIINDSLNQNSPMVCLIHGVFDGYSINLFNAISNLMQNWNNVIILLSLEGIPSNMIQPCVWNHAIYIDGDCGYEKKAFSPLHSFSVTFNLNSSSLSIECKGYKDTKKALKPFTTMLSNTQVGLYSRYLSAHNLSLNDSKLILTQLIVTAHSKGTIDQLREMFHENGVNSGEKMFDEEF